MAWIENRRGEILLLKQKRGNALWTLPGGKVGRRETLDAALRREILEETGLKAVSPVLVSIFERPVKANITFLFRVKIRGRSTVTPHPREIEAALFTSVLPPDHTPSLAYFWKQARGTATGPVPAAPLTVNSRQTPINLR